MKHEITIEVDLLAEYDYQPKERATWDCPGCPGEATINAYEIKTPIEVHDLTEYKRIDDWLKRIREAYDKVSDVMLSRSEHWQAVGALSSVLADVRRLPSLQKDMQPILDEFQEEWEADILQDIYERAADAAEARYDR